MASLRAAAFRASSLLRTPVTIRQTPSLVKPAVAQRPSAPIFLSRNYASEAASSGVEAPDYLDERERKIFDTIKGELHPTKLEVGLKTTAALGPMARDLQLRSLLLFGVAGSRYLRRLRIHVCARHRLGAV